MQIAISSLQTSLPYAATAVTDVMPRLQTETPDQPKPIAASSDSSGLSSSSQSESQESGQFVDITA